DVLRFLRRRARRPLPRREPRARPRAARGTGPARLPRLPGWARRDGLERARDGVAPVSAGTPRAGALTEEIPGAKGQDALDVDVELAGVGEREQRPDGPLGAGGARVEEEVCARANRAHRPVRRRVADDLERVGDRDATEAERAQHAVGRRLERRAAGTE